MSGSNKSKFSLACHGISDGMQNIFSPGVGRNVDGYRVRAVASDGQLPFLVLSDSGLGYLFKMQFVNGKSWDEGSRARLLSQIEAGLRLDSQEPTVEFTYAFTSVRRAIRESELDSFNAGQHPITGIRIENLKNMGHRLDVQGTDLYFSICATPSKLLKGNKVSFTDRVKSVWDKRIRYSIESALLEDVVMQFGDRVKHVLALFARLGLKTSCPMSEVDLLSMAREAWRPNYDPTKSGGKPTQAYSAAANKASPMVAGRPAVNDLEMGRLMNKRTLAEDVYTAPGDFLAKGLRMDQYKFYWFADGCLNMLFSLEEAPDPNILFSAFQSDRLGAFGIRPGVSNIPYLGTYTVAWSSMTREEGDFKFRMRNAFASGMVNDRRGMFEDKGAKKEARDVDRMHDDYIEGGTDMVRACVMYQLSVPIEHIPRYFDVRASSTDIDTLRSIARTVQQQLNEIGYSKWRLEERTYYPAWLNSMPGAVRSVENVQYLPRIYLPMDGALHLVPLFATVGPDAELFNGGNYFVSDEASVFVFDHFSKSNGTAANFSVCGATGSGKSVTVQSLVMMTERINPYIMILDFGGGNVGSWSKLCSVMNGVELKFGSARPPRINPFHLSETDSFPNRKKRRRLAIALGMDPDKDESMAAIEAVYFYLRGDDSPFTNNETRFREICDRCPPFKKLGFVESMELLHLGPGTARPGEKGSEAIRIVLELLLANSVNEDGPTDNAWATFSIDDINEAILELYESFLPDSEKTDQWPTLSDFKGVIERLNEERRRGTAKGADSWSSSGVYNFGLLMSRLSNFCRGGLDPFMDGQTNVELRKTVVKDGVAREEPSRFVLADMAGISDKRKLAIYMVIINDFMSNILYNNRDSRGIMIRDEAWFFMKSRIAAPYLEADYRLARKYGFSVVTIAQQYSDFRSAVIQNNTQTWIVCSLGSGEEIALANARFKFNDAEIDLFEQRRMGTKIERDVFKGGILDAYSRIMIANMSGKYFVKNKISKEERWITTTDDSETFVFNYYKDGPKRGMPAIELIAWLCTGEYKQDGDLLAALAKAGRVVPNI